MISVRSLIFISFLALLWSTISPLHAQKGAYKIGIGDKIAIDVWQEPDLTGTYVVAKNGTISINWVEPITLEGLTLEEAKQKVTSTLSRFLRKPVVTLSISDFRSQQITVLGEVKSPGQYYLKNDNTLIHILLREAGGVTPGAGETVSIVRLSGKQANSGPQTINVNLNKLLQGDSSQNIVLQGDDTILVHSFSNKTSGPITADSVWVLGEVNSPGFYKIREGYTVLNAILDAGNFTKFASQNSVRVSRGSGPNKKDYIVRLKDVIKSGDKAKDMVLAPGDFIYVNKSFL